MSMNNILKNLCEKMVNVIQETYTGKYYFVKISHSKNGHIYLMIKKEAGI